MSISTLNFSGACRKTSAAFDQGFCFSVAHDEFSFVVTDGTVGTTKVAVLSTLAQHIPALSTPIHEPCGCFDRLNQMLVSIRSIMVDVAMVGAGQTKFGNHPLGLKGMWAEAIEKAVQSVDNGFDSTDVEEAFIGSIAFGGSQLGNTAALLTEHSGMEGVQCTSC